VKQVGEAQIVAEELEEDGAMAGSTASIQLKEVSGDILTGLDVMDNIYASSLMHDITMGQKLSGQGKKLERSAGELARVT
jgi:hypothetical protein